MNISDNGMGDHFPSPLGARMVLVCLICLTCPFEKRQVFVIVVFFCQYLVNIGQYSYVPTYYTVLRTARYCVKYYTVPCGAM